ncbi:hypothetical protein [Marinomonas sp. IMCC 4694]|uniref:hypothetical protein n=1 Tax=Marinomonas sp. IMCC 4694 TaxID=2605432 RepID=UPI0011E88207|nr:hypothetical protein [Marinomonas sp. IMCC 4694]TYL48562.1 hypothetical protein FXV75_11790 [Marinomonas sp. IMCC 4694]
MKKISLICLLFVLVGCSASPQFLRGHYYMTGDSNCRYSRERTDTSINCYNSDDELTGYRNAMTDQQLQMYQFNKQQEEQKRQQNKVKNTNCYRTVTGGMNCTTY